MNIPTKSPLLLICTLLLQELFGLTNAQASASNYFPGASSRDVYTDWLSSVSYNKSTFIESPFDTSTGAAVHWNIEDGMIHLAVAVTQATGWASFGLAEAGSMRGADIIMYTAGTDTVSDSYVLDELVTPFVDTCQSWELTNSIVDEGFIIFEAKRLLNTSDSQDRAIMDDSNSIIPPTRVIAAWGNSTEPSFHGRSFARGAIRFFGTLDAVDEVSFFAKTMAEEAEGNFTMSATLNYIIPSNVTTTYQRFCLSTEDLVNVKGIPLDQDLHVIGFDPFVQAGNEEYVHHYVLHGLSVPFNSSMDCLDFPKLETAYIWAPGDLPLALPSNVGSPLGSAGYQAYMLEIHYTNFALTANISDNSGLQIYYTSKKREHDMGIFQLGDPNVNLMGEAVAPNGGLSQHSFVCGGGCLGQHLTDPVTVIRETLHMHITGVGMVNHQIRDDEVIRRARINFWDFDQQGDMAVVQEPFQMYPGDSFNTVCNYESTDSVIFGLASDEEMCIAFLWYYPRVIIGGGFAVSCGLGFTDFGFPECDSVYNVTSDFTTVEQLERTFGGTPSSATCQNTDLNTPTVGVPNASPVTAPVSAPQSASSSADSMTSSKFIFGTLQIFIMLSMYMFFY